MRLTATKSSNLAAQTASLQKGMVYVACRFGLGSVTYAVMAQNVLAHKSIVSKLVKLDAKASMRGCAYGVEIDCSDLKSASVALKKEGISFREIK